MLKGDVVGKEPELGVADVVVIDPDAGYFYGGRDRWCVFCVEQIGIGVSARFVWLKIIIFHKYVVVVEWYIPFVMMFRYGSSMGFVAVFIILQNNIILKSRIIHNKIL